MSKFDPAALAQFTGTERYYRIAPKFLITDGVKYLADSASCYWLINAAVSHLVQLGTSTVLFEPSVLTPIVNKDTLASCLQLQMSFLRPALSD